MPTQLPTNTLLVGGQATLAGYDVQVMDKGARRVMEDYPNPNGTHKVSITYSLRRTWDLQLTAHYGTNVETLREALSVTYDGVLCNIEDFKSSSTNKPTTCTMTLVEQADRLS